MVQKSGNVASDVMCAWCLVRVDRLLHRRHEVLLDEAGHEALGQLAVRRELEEQVWPNTRSVVYKGWLIRDEIWRLVEFEKVLGDGDYLTKWS